MLNFKYKFFLKKVLTNDCFSSILTPVLCERRFSLTECWIWRHSSVGLSTRLIPELSPVRILVPLPFFKFSGYPVPYRYGKRPGGQAAKTPPFHGGNTGSIPVRVTTFMFATIWRHSSAGRASASHAEGHRFEFCCLHQDQPFGLVFFCFYS